MDKKDYYYNPKEFRGNSRNNVYRRTQKPIVNLALLSIGWLAGVSSAITLCIKKPEIAAQLLDLFR